MLARHALLLVTLASALLPTTESITIAAVTLPGPSERERLSALAQIDLRFKPAVFADDEFPPCDFANPAAARALIGPYTLHSTFYDADRRPVDRPTKPGRYGAVVEITAAPGVEVPPRLITLYKQVQPADWTEDQFDVRIPLLPPQLGVDPKVVAEQQDLLGEQARYLLRDALLADVDTPLLVAALAESKPGDPPLAGRNSIWARNERWWYPIKQKLGRDRYEYLVDLPKSSPREGEAKPPVLLYLHGSGERGDDLNAVRANGPPKLVKAGKAFPFLIVAPQCPAGESWSTQQLKQLLDEVIAKYHADPDRVYVTGISMGGYGAWEFAAEYPDAVAALAPICGAGSPSDADRLKRLPTWVFHGRKDREVPFSRSNEMVEALKKVGNPVRFTPYPDLGHDAWTRTYDNPELYEWLLNQKRGRAANAED